jgi:hypothetical protein
MKRDLPNAEVVGVATSDFYDEGRRLLGDDGKVFVLRPDGYVGFRARMGFQVELKNYARANAFA